MHKHPGMKCRKMTIIPSKADPEKQEALTPIETLILCLCLHKPLFTSYNRVFIEDEHPVIER